MTARICDIKKMAIHDGPGIRTTIFFKGCSLKCVWCHNPESIDPRPQTAFYAHKCVGCGRCQQEGFSTEDCTGKARVFYGREVTVEEMLTAALEDRDFYAVSGGGVTLSGGECLLQADFCAELLCRLKEEGIHTAVDTCGFVSRESIDNVLPYTDLFLYDIKAIDEDVHIRCTGQPNGRILENFQYLKSQGKAIEVRYPFVPDYNDDQAQKIADFVGNTPTRVLAYHNYAGSKYEALGMENTLPERVPDEDGLSVVRAYFSNSVQ